MKSRKANKALDPPSEPLRSGSFPKIEAPRRVDQFRRWAKAERHPMEPDLVTAPNLVPVLRELMQREPIFHRPELGTSRADLENATAAEFWEVGASGRRYSREYVIETVERRGDDPRDELWVTSDFHCLEIAPDNYLLTYTLSQGSRVTRRSTIWRRMGDGWKIVYHQGTLVAAT